MSPELHEVMQRSLEAAKVLQDHISALNGTRSSGDDDSALLGTLVQLHTVHLLNHSAIVRHITETIGVDASSPLQSIVSAGAQMVKDTRQLQEYIIVSGHKHQSVAGTATSGAGISTDNVEGLQVVKNRGARPTTPASSSTPNRAYRAPTVEESGEDEEDVKSTAATTGSDVPPTTSRRKLKAYRKNKIGASAAVDAAAKEACAAADASKNTPKRRHDEQDEIATTQAMVKRTKLSPTPTMGDRKRRSDVSMVDAQADQTEQSSPSRTGKRQKQWHDHHEQQQPEEPSLAPNIEYEDIEAEVEARMQQTEQRREHERKQQLGIVDKRKRVSNDSFQMELGQQEAEAMVEKPSRKRKKHRHSGHIEG